MGLILLIPLLGTAWSVRILSRIAADTLGGNALSRRIVASGLQAVAGILIIAWLSLLIPPGLLSPKAWWIILGFLGVCVALFSRRMIGLRSFVLGEAGQVLGGATASTPIAPPLGTAFGRLGS